MRGLRRNGRSVISFGVLLSLASTLFGLWFGGDQVSPGESALIGLIGLVISFQVDILFRMERRERFVSLIDGPPWVAEAMARVAGSLDTVSSTYGTTTVTAEAEQRLASFAVELDELAQGRVRTSADDVRYMITETQKCKQSLVGVTNLQPGRSGTAWWRSEIGRNYWRTNQAALARGVRISRIFITDDEDDPSLKELVAEQCEAGAEVAVVPRVLVPAKLQRNIAVWDGAVAWEADMNAAGIAIEHVYSHSRHDVERVRRMHDTLHFAARAQDPAALVESVLALSGGLGPDVPGGAVGGGRALHG